LNNLEIFGNIKLVITLSVSTNLDINIVDETQIMNLYKIDLGMLKCRCFKFKFRDCEIVNHATIR